MFLRLICFVIAYGFITYKVSAAMSAIALLYMRLFLPESVSRDAPETDCLLEKEVKWKLFKGVDYSFGETIGLLRTRLLATTDLFFCV